MVKVGFIVLAVFSLQACQREPVEPPPSLTDRHPNRAPGLDSPDRETVIQTLRDIGDQRDLAQRQAVEACLDPSDREVFLAAVGALAQLRDPRSVLPIISAVPPRDHALMLDVMPAIADLGGDDAITFLETLTTHDDPRIRARAYALLPQDLP